jgi:ABC-type transporter Mla MlaB component
VLRITTESSGDGFTLRVEGRLAQGSLAELERTWDAATALAPAGGIRISLANLTFVDEVGRALLARLHAAGATLTASGCATRRMVFEITGQEPERCEG